MGWMGRTGYLRRTVIPGLTRNPGVGPRWIPANGMRESQPCALVIPGLTPESTITVEFRRCGVDSRYGHAGMTALRTCHSGSVPGAQNPLRGRGARFPLRACGNERPRTLVIPGLTRNPSCVDERWIPAKGMRE